MTPNDNIDWLLLWQVAIAKHGLQTLLSTNYYFSDLLSAGLLEPEHEQKLVWLCGGILSNIALHPHNRCPTLLAILPCSALPCPGLPCFPSALDSSAHCSALPCHPSALLHGLSCGAIALPIRCLSCPGLPPLVVPYLSSTTQSRALQSHALHLQPLIWALHGLVCAVDMTPNSSAVVMHTTPSVSCFPIS